MVFVKKLNIKIYISYDGKEESFMTICQLLIFMSECYYAFILLFTVIASGEFSTEIEQNFLRFFSLLTICKEAMKTKLAIEMMPDSVEDLMKKYEMKCRPKTKCGMI